MKIITKHGKKRIRERVGVRNTRYNYQYDGDFRKFLDYLAYKNKHRITVYNNYIYIIKNNILVTVLNVPNKYKNLTPIYTK